MCSIFMNITHESNVHDNWTELKNDYLRDVQ